MKDLMLAGGAVIDFFFERSPKDFDLFYIA